MKLLSEFKNRYNKITYRTYELDNGIQLLHLLNPSSIDFDIAIVVRAGASFETKENVPKGTAHFLEHMLMNPNSTFPTQEDLNRFEQGNRYRPSIYTNALTTRKNIYLTGHTNKKGISRMIKRISSEIEFDEDKFNEFLEREREVILAERSRKPKKERDSHLMNLEFLFKDTLPEFTGDIVGEVDDIKSINLGHLERYFKNRFTSGNTVFAIQSGEKLDREIIRKINRLSHKFHKGSTDSFRKIELKNEWSVGTFVDEKASGVSIAFLYFVKENEKIDYKKYAIESIFSRLIDWLSFEILREEKALIYDLSSFKVRGTCFQYSIEGFRFVTENEKAPRMLEELYTLINKEAFDFIHSQKGIEWFNDVLSSFIFPRTVKFDSEIAENEVTSVLEGDDIFNSNKFVKASKEVTLKDLESFLKERIEVPPHIWIESDLEEKEMLDIIGESSFKKKFA